LHRVFHGLLGQPVLQFKCGNRQAVDKKAKIQRKLRLILAVPELPRDAEDILSEPRDGRG
jgi:hypothetical protein